MAVKKTIARIMMCALVLALAACSTSGVDVETANSSLPEATAVSLDADSVAEVLAEHGEVHEEAADTVWDEAAVIDISLDGGAIAVEGEGVTIEGSTATITSAGTYRLSGSLADGQVVVDTEDEDIVRLILNGIDLHSATSAPIYIVDAEEVVIVLAEGAENHVSDSASYIQENAEEDEPNAAIFSKADLTFYGSGALTVTGNYQDGIASKDGLVIASGTLTVRAADDGIRGKDYLVIQAGTISVNAQGDGLKADNDEDATAGYIAIEAGSFDLTAGGDAITAATEVLIAGGAFTLASGGGSGSTLAVDASAKGIKAAVNVVIDGGAFTIDAADDAIHSNAGLTINGGTFDIATDDDGLHADATLTINDGTLRISESYEGLESAVITINAGDVEITASDDGVNVVGGVDGSGMGGARGPGRGPGQETFTYTGSNYLYIHGGSLVIEAGGDGIDVGGAIEMTGGVVLVNGPTEQMNGSLDYDATFTLTGGTLVAVGSAGMAEAPGQTSSQYSVLVNLNTTEPAGTLVHIQNSAGEDLLTFAPTKAYQSIAFSSPELAQGETYTVYTGGSTNGTAANGLYQDGAYTPGTERASFTIASIVTLVGNSRMR
jgi:hypothetical protein